jgi:DNA-binding response OmpR family regulator
VTDSPRVLIVEDQEEVAETYQLRLGDAYETEIALSGEEGLQVIDDEVAVVLLDRRMPGISGDEVLERVRNRGLDCRVVMVTAVDPDFDIADMDIDGYVVKPVDREQLLSVVDRALTIAEYNDNVQRLNSLKLKRNVLEVEMDQRELDDSGTYQELVADIETLESELSDLEGDLDLDQVELYL